MGFLGAGQGFVFFSFFLFPFPFPFLFQFIYFNFFLRQKLLSDSELPVKSHPYEMSVKYSFFNFFFFLFLFLFFHFLLFRMLEGEAMGFLYPELSNPLCGDERFLLHFFTRPLFLISYLFIYFFSFSPYLSSKRANRLFEPHARTRHSQEGCG